jgi:hypothetical protein
VGLTCLVIAACDPTPGAITGGGSGGGAGGGGGASPSLVGNWRHLRQTTTTGGEMLVVETQWSFTTDSSCTRTYHQTFVERGQQFFETRACTYSATAATLAILYEGTSTPVTFPYRFQGEDLLLDGFLFVRF